MFLGKKIQQKTSCHFSHFETIQRFFLFFPKKKAAFAPFCFGFVAPGGRGDSIKFFYILSFTFSAAVFDTGVVFPGKNGAGAGFFPEKSASFTDFFHFCGIIRANPPVWQEKLLFFLFLSSAGGPGAQPSRRCGFILTARAVQGQAPASPLRPGKEG